MTINTGLRGRAWFSEGPDPAYRYSLERQVGPSDAREMVVIGLNPSMADHNVPDPTSTRCEGFAAREGCGWLRIVNAFAIRETDPKLLPYFDDPVGPHNDEILADVARSSALIVAAWGAGLRPFPGRAARVLELLAGAELWCLGTTTRGEPRHPLYLRGDSPLLRWTPA